MTLRTTYSDNLARLLKDICKVPSALDTHISGLSIDSRHVKKGDLFLALSGNCSNATDHIKEAIAKGANAVVAEGNLNNGKVFEDGLAVELFVNNLKDKVGLIADRFYRSPSRDMAVIGVTGTNGKTSVTHYLAQYFADEHNLSGVIGTLGYGVIGKAFSGLKETGFTTPNAVAVHRSLAELRDTGVSNVFMEVSSHGLDQGRVDGVRFEGAVFTNLTREHLDYHGTMQAYAESKCKLFRNPGLKFAVVNLDDAYAGQVIGSIPSGVDIFTYGIKSKADISVLDCQLGADSLSTIKADISSPAGEFNIHSSLIGLFNLSNLLAVISVALAKQSLKNCEQRIQALQPVNGRMQLVHLKNKPTVVIDYAHTPDALENALSALKPHCKGNMILVFGCGGDRDPGKRAEMATVAEKLADQIIVTDDNPRFESPEKITNDIFAGFKRPATVILEHERDAAIRFALEQASVNDLVLIAGKGHESWQEIKGEKTHFSDLEQVQINLGIKRSSQARELSV
jgi:UDP-N-acetylmuramoyl-L-alanyl-D-glutamate--2,6-diaminopimelate ligase